MNTSSKRKDGLSQAIFGLWRNWAVAVGLLTLLAICAPFMPQLWLPIVNLLCYCALQWVRNELGRRAVPTCGRFLQEVSVIMLLTALLLLVISVTNRYVPMFELNGQPFETTSPLLVILITAPVAALVTLTFYLSRKQPAVCQQCKARHGNAIEHGFVGDLFQREWRYQTLLLFLLTVVLTMVDWAYYYAMYVNVNLNHADMFFFVWLPLIIYVLSLIYLGVRYYSMWMFFCQNNGAELLSTPPSTTLRYLIISDDRMLLDICATDGRFDNGAVVKRFDTPAMFKTAYRENPSQMEAERLFGQHTGIPHADVRLAYASPDTVIHQNMFHYFAFIDNSEAIADSKVQGEWFTWGQIHQLASQVLLSRELVAELTRIYKVAMALKTYDRQGRRLYPVKHYRPTFRLRDIKTWNVDFGDFHWLEVSRHNQDTFLSWLRRFFWRGYAAE